MKYPAFVIVNPWAVPWEREILEIMDNGPIKRVGKTYVLNAPRVPFKMQYSRYKGKPFLELYLNAIEGKEIVFAAYVGEGTEMYKVMQENKRIVRKEFQAKMPNLTEEQEEAGVKIYAAHCSEKEYEATIELAGWGNYFKRKGTFDLFGILKSEGINLESMLKKKSEK